MEKLQELEARLTAVEAALRGLGQGQTLANVQRDIDRAAEHARKEKAAPKPEAEAVEPKTPKHRSHH